ncbi:hypothetical protein PN36_13965 [Candidatus Thiomargarita nelsonii]|uniref:Uncharacterized protein n=1 Tax=Candidatus Thiomargarita nelsonii TaxID=1003181 RepID=A0A0A6P8A0_9GAMM|nr:hypothetical protein PN36_13965 [Candidatus Thiomargarita nelsonii]
MNLQLKSLKPRLNSKVDLFLNQAAITEQNAVSLKPIILDYVNRDDNKYVLFRHSSLYFFADGALDFVQETANNFADTHYLRFDGEKVMWTFIAIVILLLLVIAFIKLFRQTRFLKKIRQHLLNIPTFDNGLIDCYVKVNGRIKSDNGFSSPISEKHYGKLEKTRQRHGTT